MHVVGVHARPFDHVRSTSPVALVLMRGFQARPCPLAEQLRTCTFCADSFGLEISFRIAGAPQKKNTTGMSCDGIGGAQDAKSSEHGPHDAALRAEEDAGARADGEADGEAGAHSAGSLAKEVVKSIKLRGAAMDKIGDGMLTIGNSVMLMSLSTMAVTLLAVAKRLPK